MNINELKEALRNSKEDEKIVMLNDDDTALLISFTTAIICTQGKVPHRLLKIITSVLQNYVDQEPSVNRDIQA